MAARRPRTATDAQTPGQRLAAPAWAELLPLGPSVPAGLRRPCSSAPAHPPGFGASAAASLLGSAHASLHSPMAFSTAESCGGATSSVVSDQWARFFLGWETLPLGGGWIGSGRHCRQQIAAGAARGRTPHPCSRRPTLKGLRPRWVVRRHGRTRDFVCVQSRSIIRDDQMPARCREAREGWRRQSANRTSRSQGRPAQKSKNI